MTKIEIMMGLIQWGAAPRKPGDRGSLGDVDTFRLSELADEIVRRGGQGEGEREVADGKTALAKLNPIGTFEIRFGGKPDLAGFEARLLEVLERVHGGDRCGKAAPGMPDAGGCSRKKGHGGTHWCERGDTSCVWNDPDDAPDPVAAGLERVVMGDEPATVSPEEADAVVRICTSAAERSELGLIDAARPAIVAELRQTRAEERARWQGSVAAAARGAAELARLLEGSHAPPASSDEIAAAGRVLDRVPGQVNGEVLQEIESAIVAELQRARRLGAFDASGDAGVLRPGDLRVDG